MTYKIYIMSEKAEFSKGVYGALFAVGAIVCGIFVFNGSPWFWTSLPFLLSGLTGLLDGM